MQIPSKNNFKSKKSIKVIKCRLCGARSRFLFYGKLIKKDVQYFDCQDCGYVQTEQPYWIEEAYSDSINVSDTGIMERNLENSKIVFLIALALGIKDSKIIDFAGGYGILVRLLRDLGLNAYWMDKYSENLLSRGFEYHSKINNCRLVTAFEVFEHLINPCEELEEMFSIAPLLLFSTELISDKVPSFDNWSYYGKEHGQHIGFFRLKTLSFLAEKYQKKFVTNGLNYHLFYNQKESQISIKLFRYLLKLKRLMPLFRFLFFKSKILSDNKYLSTL
tara:strand:- start:10762 stop:11589 length:828 start_codon:yes stop_codon:yes gene_type:complete